MQLNPENLLLYTLITLTTLLITLVFYIYHYLKCCQLKCIKSEMIGPDPIVTDSNEKFHIFNPSIVLDKRNDILIIARMSAINPGTCSSTTFLNYQNDYKANMYLNKFGKNKEKISSIIYWNYNNPKNYKIIHNYDLNESINKIQLSEAIGLEDPRLFKFNNNIWVYAHYRGYKNNKFTHNPVIFKLNEPNRLIFLKYDKMTSYEKNWMPFEYNNELYFEYSIYPRLILKCNHITGFCSEVYNTKGNSWFLYKPIGGGAPPQLIPDKNIFLGIAHTRPTGILERKSFFYTFSAFPPFNLLGTSNEFYIEDKYNANIEFASGLLVKDNEVIVSCGIQDCYSRLIHYNLQDVLNFIN